MLMLRTAAANTVLMDTYQLSCTSLTSAYTWNYQSIIQRPKHVHRCGVLISYELVPFLKCIMHLLHQDKMTKCPYSYIELDKYPAHLSVQWFTSARIKWCVYWTVLVRLYTVETWILTLHIT